MASSNTNENARMAHAPSGRCKILAISTEPVPIPGTGCSRLGILPLLRSPDSEAENDARNTR